jgi:Tfp pilus assembly protein PilN
MFTIDLLNGQNIPRKSSPGSIATAASTSFVPVVIAILMLGLYIRNKVVLSVQADTIANYETKIKKLSDAMVLQKSFDEQINTYNNILSEISGNLNKHTQWSPILVEMVKNMPDSVVLTTLDVKQRSVRKKVPQKDNPKQMIDISVPVRTLQMTMSGRPQSNSDQDIKNFSDSIRSSSLLGPKIEDVRISQGLAKLDGKDVVSYQIDCIFKPGM